MSTNPLKKRTEEQAQPKRSAQDWCDRGNALLAGLIPFEHGKQFAGTYQSPPRTDVRWVVRNGRPVIELVQ